MFTVFVFFWFSKWTIRIVVKKTAYIPVINVERVHISMNGSQLLDLKRVLLKRMSCGIRRLERQKPRWLNVHVKCWITSLRGIHLQLVREISSSLF